MTGGEFWTGPQCSAHCGLTPGDWRTRVSRGLAPAPDVPDDDRPANRRMPLWDPETVKAWHADRRIGRGRPPKNAKL